MMSWMFWKRQPRPGSYHIVEQTYAGTHRFYVDRWYGGEWLKLSGSFDSLDDARAHVAAILDYERNAPVYNVVETYDVDHPPRVTSGERTR